MGKLHRLDVHGQIALVIEQPRSGELMSLLARSRRREARFVLDGDRLYVMDADIVLHADLRSTVAPALDLSLATNGGLYHDPSLPGLVVVAVPSQRREHVRRANVLHRLARPGRLYWASALNPDTPVMPLDPSAQQDGTPAEAVAATWRQVAEPRLRALADAGADGSNWTAMLASKAREYLDQGPPSFVDDGHDWVASRRTQIRITEPGSGQIRLGACETGFIYRDTRPTVGRGREPQQNSVRVMALDGLSWHHGDGEIDAADQVLLEVEMACAMVDCGFAVRIDPPGTRV